MIWNCAEIANTTMSLTEKVVARLSLCSVSEKILTCIA
nr:MAG TPA: hypothetical protein [Caudoviricetes sp.]